MKHMAKQLVKAQTPEWMSHEQVSDSLLSIEGVGAGIEQQQRISRLGDMLRHVRSTYLKMTQTDAAKLLGMPQSELSRLESGTGAKGPTFATVTAIVDRYEQYLAPSGVEIALSLNVSVDSGKATNFALAGRVLHEEG